jgi:hypothetical protein
MRVIYQCEGEPAESDEYVVEGVDVKPGQVTIRVRPLRPPALPGQEEQRHVLACADALWRATRFPPAPDDGSTLYLAQEAYYNAARAYASAKFRYERVTA